MTDLQDMANVLEAECEKKGWGDEDTFVPNIIMVVKGADGYRPRLLPIDDEMWSAAPSVGAMLRSLAKQLSERDDFFTVMLRRAIAEVQPVALFIHTEGWALTMPEDKYNEYYETAEKRQIHRHPERKECRVINGVLIDGSETAAVMRIRDEEPRPDGGFSGDVPDGLMSLATAFQLAINSGKDGGVMAEHMRNAIEEFLKNDG